MEITTCRPVRREREARDGDQAVGPFGRKSPGATQLAPVLGERLDVRDLVRGVGLKQAIEPCGTCCEVGRRAGNDGHEFGDHAIVGAADRTGGTVDVLQRRRDAFEQRDRTLCCQNWLESCDLFDLGECFLEPRNGWLRLPSKGVPSKSCLEAPGVTTSFRHATVAILAGNRAIEEEPAPCCACAMLTVEMPRAHRPGSTTANRLKHRSREDRDVVLDAGERRLVKSVERGDWTTIGGFRAAKARHARSAAATLRRPRKA